MPAKQISPRILVLTVMRATFMEVLDTSVANVPLPHIAGKKQRRKIGTPRLPRRCRCKG